MVNESCTSEQLTTTNVWDETLPASQATVPYVSSESSAGIVDMCLLPGYGWDTPPCVGISDFDVDVDFDSDGDANMCPASTPGRVKCESVSISDVTSRCESPLLDDCDDETNWRTQLQEVLYFSENSDGEFEERVPQLSHAELENLRFQEDIELFLEHQSECIDRYLATSRHLHDVERDCHEVLEEHERMDEATLRRGMALSRGDYELKYPLYPWSSPPSEIDSDPGVRIEDLDILDNQFLFREEHDEKVDAELWSLLVDTKGCT